MRTPVYRLQLFHTAALALGALAGSAYAVYMLLVSAGPRFYPIAAVVMSVVHTFAELHGECKMQWYDGLDM